MNAQRASITLPYMVLKQLQSSFPAGKRSQFFAKELSEKLKTKLQDVEKSLKLALDLET